MPENSPAPTDTMVHYYFIRLIDLVNIQIKIIVDDISRRCDQYRRDN
jgi:hypothetical protein